MNLYDKPLLGCAPSYIPACERIQNLAEAIYRFGATAEHYPGRIKKWAREIIFQCDIIEEFYSEELKRSEMCKEDKTK